MIVTYSHKSPPQLAGGPYACCPVVIFAQGIPDTNPEPIDDDGFSLLIFPTGSDPDLLERLHTHMAAKLRDIAVNRGFTACTPEDVQRVSAP
jgi:hypothetical protein